MYENLSLIGATIMIGKSIKTPWFAGADIPEVSDKSFISPTATLIGKVVVKDYVLVSPGASLRADEGGEIHVCHNSNVQDNVIMHGLKDKRVEVAGESYSIFIGANTSCAHASIIHGPAAVGENSFFGFTAVVHSSTVGDNCFIGHGAKVIGVNIPDGKFVPHGAIITSAADVAKLLEVPSELKHFNEEVVEVNTDLAKSYLDAYGPIAPTFP